MTIALAVLVCLLAVGMFLLFGALVEVYRQVDQIRTYLRLIDEEIPIDLGAAAGLPATAIGLPAAVGEEPSTLVLFLSNKCTACRSIARAFNGVIPPSLWVVVEPVFDHEADAFIAEHRLGGERLIVDHGGQIAERLRLDVTPSVLFVEGGKLERASSVASSRQLFSMLPLVRQLNQSFSQDSTSQDSTSDAARSREERLLAREGER